MPVSVDGSAITVFLELEFYGGRGKLLLPACNLNVKLLADLSSAYVLEAFPV